MKQKLLAIILLALVFGICILGMVACKSEVAATDTNTDTDTEVKLTQEEPKKEPAYIDYYHDYMCLIPEEDFTRNYRTYRMEYATKLSFYLNGGEKYPCYKPSDIINSENHINAIRVYSNNEVAIDYITNAGNRNGEVYYDIITYNLYLNDSESFYIEYVASPSLMIICNKYVKYFKLSDLYGFNKHVYIQNDNITFKDNVEKMLSLNNANGCNIEHVADTQTALSKLTTSQDTAFAIIPRNSDYLQTAMSKGLYVVRQ